MKYKHILLTTAVAIIISGCGNNNHTNSSNQPDSDRDDLITFDPYAWIEDHATAPRFDYIFGGTLVITPPPRNVLGQGLLYEGIVSNTFKKTLHKIWTSLSEKGFSGFDESLLLLEKEFNFSLSSSGGSTPYHSDIACPAGKRDFAERVIEPYIEDPKFAWEYHDYIIEKQYLFALMGLKYQNKALALVKKMMILMKLFLQWNLGKTQRVIFIKVPIISHPKSTLTFL